MTRLKWRESLSRKGCRVVLSDLPVAMHCHHYNINIQKTLEDTLGEAGIELLFRSAEETAHHNFRSLIERYPHPPVLESKLELLADLYRNCGLGVIHFEEITPDHGLAISPSSHHVTGWLAKHGRRETPGCHFSRGWLAGVLAVIFHRPVGHFRVAETECKMMRSDVCRFEIERRYGH